MTGFEFKKKIVPLLIKIGVGLGIGLLVIVLTYVLDIDFLRKVELLTLDFRYQNRYDLLGSAGELKDFAREGKVVIVGISEEDSKAMPSPFPFPRSYYAHVIENLNRVGAAAIAFDITFESPRDGDDTLRQVLRKYDNVILAVKLPDASATERAYVRSIERTYTNVFYDVNKRVGVVSLIKDRDDIARRYFPMLYIGDFLTPTFAFASLNRYFQLAPDAVADVTDVIQYHQIAIPKFDEGSFLLNYYGPNKTIPYISFSQVIDDESFTTKDEADIGEQLNLFDETTARRLFQGKVVLIGSTMPEERDYHSVPIANPDGNTLMNGVEIHATAIQNVIDQDFIIAADTTTEIVIVLLLSLGLFLLFLRIKQIKFKYTIVIEIGVVLLVLLFIGAVFEFSVLAFANANTMFSIMNPTLAIVFCYFGTQVYQYLVERQQKAMIKNIFSHYISAAVVNELAANPEKAKLGGDKRELTVFFSDIAGFTTISESLSPEQLVLMLNEYLDEMTEIVLKYGGTLDKYEGDAIMAFWGAPIPQKDHALRTCLAALEMQKRLAQLRPKWKKEGKPMLEVRCGINTGQMIVGNMGGKDRFDYTVIGDSVNLASRLEGANKQYGSYIMISDMTYQHVKGKLIVRELDLIQVKGKTEPVKVWEVLGTSDMQQTEEQKQANELYHEGLKLYRAKNWQEAIAHFQQAYKLDNTCRVAEIYEQRSNLYQLNPPPEDWNGVFVMTTK